MPGGLLEDSYFKRTPWTSGGEYARLIVRDTSSVYYVRMFDSLRGLDPTVFFTPGRNGYLLFSKNADSRRNAWTQRVPVRIRAMLAAGDRLFVAGPPDVVDPKDPLGASKAAKAACYTSSTRPPASIVPNTVCPRRPSSTAQPPPAGSCTWPPKTAASRASVPCLIRNATGRQAT